MTRATGHPGAVTLILRFGSALNLNIHFHLIFLDGVYLPVEGAAPVFRHVPAPSGAQLQTLVHQMTARIGKKMLEQRGLIERDIANAWLATQGSECPLDHLIGHSITCRIAVGPRADQKLFTLQTMPARAEQAEQQGDHRSAANSPSRCSLISKGARVSAPLPTGDSVNLVNEGLHAYAFSAERIRFAGRITWTGIQKVAGWMRQQCISFDRSPVRVKREPLLNCGL